jgi:hypothetical protein
MSHSYIGYNGHGFWTEDYMILAWHSVFRLYIEAAGIVSPWSKLLVRVMRSACEGSAAGCFGYRVEEFVQSAGDVGEMQEAAKHTVESLKVAMALGVSEVDVALSGVLPDFFWGREKLAPVVTVGDALMALLSDTPPAHGVRWEYISWMDAPPPSQQ